MHPKTGQIGKFRLKETIKFTDPKGLLSAPANPVTNPLALNGLNPLGLNTDVGRLGRSFDPEGFVVDPRTCRFLVADEYGPSVYEFSRAGPGTERRDHQDDDSECDRDDHGDHGDH